jgi:hypothetical protein
LCGLYSQLERAWEAGDSSTKAQVVELLQRLNRMRSKDQSVQEWRKLVADTLGQPDWKDTLPPLQHKFRRWKNERHECNLQMISKKRMPPGELQPHLLDAAWSNCEQAQRFYADARIREYYTQQRRLDIERLSGDLLLMESCYINLAIVEQSGERKTEPSYQRDKQPPSSPFALFSRLKVGAPDTYMQVSLPTLFLDRKRRDGTNGPPGRILIRGRAGVGKTTLCKKIVYDFIHHKLWAGLFDRLVWVPLRMLKGMSECNLEKVLYEMFFSQMEEGGLLARESSKTIYDRTSRRTLFILDGLDEVS